MEETEESTSGYLTAEKKHSIIVDVAQVATLLRSVAQLGRALRSGRRGRGFESRRFDYY